MPTYETSSEDDHGNAIWTPVFHCTDEGSSASYQKMARFGGVTTDAPLGSDCSVPYRTVDP